MAKSAFQVSGQKKVLNNLFIAKNKILARVAEAVEKTSVDVANHAKANHVEGQAHSEGRFERDTGTLVRSIHQELETVNFEEVTAVVFTNLDYAIPVEFGGNGRRAYPFMFPALVANQENLKNRLKAAQV